MISVGRNPTHQSMIELLLACRSLYWERGLKPAADHHLVAWEDSQSPPHCDCGLKLMETSKGRHTCRLIMVRMFYEPITYENHRFHKSLEGIL